MDDIYQVEEILAHKIINKKLHYFIKWQSWSEEYNTWEPEKNIKDKSLIENYQGRNRIKRKSLSVPSMEVVVRNSDGNGKNTNMPAKKKQKTSGEKSTVVAAAKSSTTIGRSSSSSNELKNFDELVPEKITGARYNDDHELEFLIKWTKKKSVSGKRDEEFVPAKIANLKWPQFIIKFYEDRIVFK